MTPTSVVLAYAYMLKGLHWKALADTLCLPVAVYC